MENWFKEYDKKYGVQLYDKQANRNLSSYRHGFRSKVTTFEEMVAILNKFLKFNRNDRVADIGGSTGSISRIISKHVSHITMADWSQKQVDIAIEFVRDSGIENMDCICSSFPNLNEMKDGVFTKIIVGSVLHHINWEPGPRARAVELSNSGRSIELIVADAAHQQWGTSLENMYRILANDGEACLYHIYGDNAKAKLYKNNPSMRNLIGFISFNQIKDMAEKIGFKSCEKIYFALNPSLPKGHGVEHPDLGLNVLLRK